MSCFYVRRSSRKSSQNIILSKEFPEMCPLRPSLLNKKKFVENEPLASKLHCLENKNFFEKMKAEVDSTNTSLKKRLKYESTGYVIPLPLGMWSVHALGMCFPPNGYVIMLSQLGMCGFHWVYDPIGYVISDITTGQYQYWATIYLVKGQSILSLVRGLTM